MDDNSFVDGCIPVYPNSCETYRREDVSYLYLDAFGCLRHLEIGLLGVLLGNAVNLSTGIDPQNGTGHWTGDVLFDPVIDKFIPERGGARSLPCRCRLVSSDNCCSLFLQRNTD